MSFIKTIKKNYIQPNIKQFLKFGIVGLSNTLIAFAIYYVLIYLDISYIIANTVSFIVSVMNAYYLNNKFVFGNLKKYNIVKPVIKVYISYGITFMINTSLLFIMVNYCIISKYIAPLFVMIITIPLNFFLNKYWVFK